MLIFTEDATRGATLAEMGVVVETIPASHGRLDLAAVIDRMGELEVNELLVEAGPTLSGEMLRQGLVDELLLYLAPKLLGPQGLPLVDLPELGDLQDALGSLSRECSGWRMTCDCGYGRGEGSCFVYGNRAGCR